MKKEIIEEAGYCVQCNAPLYDCRDCGAGDPLKFAKAIVDHHDKYGWHDLRKNPDDLPKQAGWYDCVLKNHEDDEEGYPSFEYDEEYGFGIRQNIFHPISLGFVDDVFETMEDIGYEPVVAWREIEPFESED